MSRQQVACAPRLHHTFFVQTSLRSPEIRRIGNYAVERLLATGGYAEIYLARLASARGEARGPRVALKLPLGQASEQLASLRCEAAALKRIEHPNIVRLLEDGTASSSPHLVMEYVSGVDLHRLRTRSSATQAAVPFDLACFVCREVARALACIHGVPADGHDAPAAHGDIAPSNLFLSMQGEVRLGDFGMSTLSNFATAVSGDSSESPAAPRGHKGYLSPERLCGREPSAAADIFALGAVLAEMLIGRSAFAGDGDLARLLSARDGNIDPLLAQRSRVPPALLELCRSMLNSDAQQRPTADGVANALTALIAAGATTEADLQRSLSAWVRWACNTGQYSQQLEEQVRSSVQAQRAAQTASGVVTMSGEPNPRLLRHDSGAPQSVSFPELLEMAASGVLLPEDEVALWGGPFQTVSTIPALSRHLLPSTSALTSPCSPLGAADFIAQLEETPFFDVLATMATRGATGTLFVQRSGQRGPERKDLYLRAGRLMHVTSSDRNERLGRSLVREGLLTPPQLAAALRHMVDSQGQLGESLIALKLVDPVVVFTALRNQGRARAVSLCAWTTGTAAFFANAEPEQLSFPLDLDLHVCLIAAAAKTAVPLPDRSFRLTPGPHCPPAGSNRSTVPLLNVIPSIARKRVTIATAVEELSLLSGRGVTTSPCSYLHVARCLGWVEFG